MELYVGLSLASESAALEEAIAVRHQGFDAIRLKAQGKNGRYTFIVVGFIGQVQ